VRGHPLKGTGQEKRVFLCKKISSSLPFIEMITRYRRKRDKSIGKAVWEHGYTQREVADHPGIHFTCVRRILGAKDKMLTK
jgi:hypothetical protein